MVLKGGLEPPRAKAHCPLKTACLPVPPLQQILFGRLNSIFNLTIASKFFLKLIWQLQLLHVLHLSHPVDFLQSLSVVSQKQFRLFF